MALLIGPTLGPLLIILQQIDENAVEEMISIRNEFHNRNKKMKKFITIGVKSPWYIKGSPVNPRPISIAKSKGVIGIPPNGR